MSTIKQASLFGDDPIKADHSTDRLRAPFPYFGGKSGIAELVWYAFGEVKQYIEPFCGSAAVLLGNPKPASLEVAGDVNCYIANFWRAVKYQPDAVAERADYPVSHIDLAARHRWLVDPERTAELARGLADPEWPGDAQIAGWWCWGQCAWIGSGWCDSGGGQYEDPARQRRRSRSAVRFRSPDTRDEECNRGGRSLMSATLVGEFKEREREREHASATSLVGRAGDQPWRFL